MPRSRRRSRCLRDLLSQRSGQVQEKLAELIGRWSDENDGADPDPRTIADLERSAAVFCRPSKTHGVDGATLHDTWTDQARATGFDPAGLTANTLPGRSHEPDLSDEALIADALHRAAEESATWLRADVARHLATLLPVRHGAPAAVVVDRIDRLAARAESVCHPLSPDRRAPMPCRRDGRPVAEHVTDRRLTTDTVLRQELDLQHWAQTHTQPTPTTVADPQAAAVEAMAGDAGLVVVVGPAGTGKTTATAQQSTIYAANGDR